MEPNEHAILRTTMQVLTSRLILIIGMILDFLLFGYAAWEPSWPRLIGAGAFAVLVLVGHLVSTIR